MIGERMSLEKFLSGLLAVKGYSNEDFEKTKRRIRDEIIVSDDGRERVVNFTGGGGADSKSLREIVLAMMLAPH